MQIQWAVHDSNQVLLFILVNLNMLELINEIEMIFDLNVIKLSIWLKIL